MKTRCTLTNRVSYLMRSGYSVEQVFLKLRGGLMNVELVLVAPSGAIKHDKLSFPTRSEFEAVRRGAAHLAARGDVERANGARVRVERRGQLKDEASLKKLFAETFEDALEG